MIQSPNDDKNYRPLTLDNGLRVLLIENRHSSKAAASLAVNAGHFDDPDDRQGLAHFLEHMLFLGTENFPDGSEYQKFISQFGGNHNAWTGTEHTCFFFDIHHEHYAPALERFSDFFKNPLLSEEFIVSERQNIDAEFKLKLKDDIRRLYDVHKETINQKHPFAKFSVGNVDTLGDRDGVSVRQEIADFYEKYYHANLMTLALEAPLSLDELETLANQYFIGIKKTKLPKSEVSEPLYLTEHKNVRIKVKPVKNDKQLIVSFALPCIDQYYKNKPEALLAYLLGHEGPGSILSYLKKKQWAFRLTAGSGINGSNFKDFNLSIALTDEGLENIDSIVSAISYYLKLLKSKPIAEHYFSEKKAIAEQAFVYHEPMKPIDSVSHLAVNMQHYPSEHYLYGDYILESFDLREIEYLLNYLDVSNMRVMEVSQHVETNQISQWYQVPYHVEKIAQSTITHWQEANLDNALFLPGENPYIVENPTIVPMEEAQVIPTKFVDKSGFKGWFKQDQSFGVPKGYVYLCIDSPLAIASSKNIVLTRLFVETYSDSVIEENYDAELAGMHYHLYPHQGGMTLQLSGYSEKQPILLEELLGSLFNQSFSIEKFTLIKNQLLSHFSNTDKSKSISQLFSKLSSALQPSKPGSTELIESLKAISFDDFCEFSKQLFDQLHLELLVHGNWQRKDAVQIAELIDNHFSGKYHDNYRVDVQIVDTSDLSTINFPMHLADHDDACVCYYPLASNDIPQIAITMVLAQLLAPDFFQEMRTEKQYGYLVGVGYVPIGSFPGIALYIQSPHTEALKLEAEILNFFKHASTILDNVGEQQWQQLQQGLASQLMESDASLRIKSQRFWGSICNKDYEFNRKQHLIDSINQLTLTDIKTFFVETFIQQEKKDRLSLLAFKSEAAFSEFVNSDKHIFDINKLQKNTKRKS